MASLNKEISNANVYRFIVRPRYVNRAQDKWINASQTLMLFNSNGQRGESVIAQTALEGITSPPNTHPPLISLSPKSGHVLGLKE